MKNNIKKNFKEEQNYKSEIINIIKSSSKFKKKSFKKFLKKTISKPVLNIISIILIILSISFKFFSHSIKQKNKLDIFNIKNKENRIFIISTLFASFVIFFGIHRLINFNIIMLYLLIFWFIEMISKKFNYHIKDEKDINLFLELILIWVCFLEFIFLNIRFTYNRKYIKTCMTMLSGIFICIFYIRLNGVFIKLF
jgi:hypothetical protein